MGYKGKHARDVGLAGAPDGDILNYAKNKKSLLITKDLDFGTLVVNSKIPTYGIVILRLPFTFNAAQINSALKTFLKAVKIRNLNNSITIVELGRYRIRRLV